MKKQDITYSEKLNELRLDISHPNSKGMCYILVEGDSDIRIFRTLYNDKTCKIENIPGGNSKLEECVEELLKTYKFVIGIRDADFIKLENTKYIKINMFLTDFHDFEMSMVSELKVLRKVLTEYTNLISDAESTRLKILNSLEDISTLKWLNYKSNLELAFAGVSFFDLISAIDHKVDLVEYFKRVKSKSINSKVEDLKSIEQDLENLKKSNPDKFQLTNGHDFISVVTKFIQLHKTNSKNIGIDQTSSSIRLAYSIEYFKLTELYSDTKRWAESNNLNVFN